MESTKLSPVNLSPQLQTAFEKLDIHPSPESFESAASPSDLMTFSNTNTEEESISAPQSLLHPHRSRPRRITTFPRFSDLPAELRLKIWKYAQPEQRYFTTSFQFAYDEPPITNYITGRYWDIFWPQRTNHTTSRYWDISCSQPSPALLFVCREPRDETLTDYLPIRFRPPPSSRGGAKTKTLYINPKTDVVYLSDMNRAFKVVSAFAKQGVHIRKLGYWCSEGRAWKLWHFMRQSADYEIPLFSALKKATELEELQIEVGDEIRCDGARRLNGVMSFRDPTKSEIEGWLALELLLRSSNDVESLINATFERLLKENENWKRPDVKYGVFEYVEG